MKTEVITKKKVKMQLKNQSIKNKEDEELVNPAAHDQDLLNDINFIPVKVDESFSVDYIKYESNGDTFFKRFSLIGFVDEIKNI